MNTKKPRLLMAGHSDEMQTPEVAIYPLLPYLKKEWTIWECAWGKGSLANHLEKMGYLIMKEWLALLRKQHIFVKVVVPTI